MTDEQATALLDALRVVHRELEAVSADVRSMSASADRILNALADLNTEKREPWQQEGE